MLETRANFLVGRDREAVGRIVAAGRFRCRARGFLLPSRPDHEGPCEKASRRTRWIANSARMPETSQRTFSGASTQDAESEACGSS